MAKYIIDIPDEEETMWEGFNGDLFIPITMNKGTKTWVNTDLKMTPYTEPDRKAIEDEVWKFARGLLNYTDDDWETITNMLLLDIPYQSAKEKYEAWKAEKEEIRVGDEVVYHGNKYVVGYVGADEVYHIVDRNWIRTVVQGDYQIHKTGRHFDEVEELLKKITGESNED